MMNDQEIESALQKAPKINPPPGLLERLQADMAVPRLNASPNTVSQWWLMLRRWVPATVCLVFVGVLAAQVNTDIKLRREPVKPPGSIKNLDQLRRENLEFRRLSAQNQELARLRKDYQETESLRAEIDTLRKQLTEAATVRAENQNLRLQLSVVSGNQRAADMFETAQAKAKSIKCVNNLKNIGLGVRVYAADNDNRTPTAFLQLTNEFATPKILVCPSDEPRKDFPELGWAGFRPEMTSYQFYLTGDQDEIHPQRILAKCPIHGHVCLADGSVHQNIGPERQVMINGRLTLANPPGSPR